MGSFNVACSISSLSISAGTEVVFFPLLPIRYGNSRLENAKYLIYPNCYYQPFSLPIKGRYNDYGSVESIEEDENTKAIETFFGIGIEAFIEHIGDGCPKSIKDEDKREIYQQLSGMFVHREIYEELIAFDLKDKNLANGYLTEEIAAFYGFEKVPEEQQMLLDNYHSVLMRKEGLPYDLKIGQYGAELLHQDLKEYYAFAFDQRYGKEIALNWEQTTGTKLADVFSSEFNFEKLTKEQYLVVKEKFKELTGSPLGFSEDRSNKHSIFSVKQFANVYKEVTGETLDIDVWSMLSQYDQSYSDFQMALRTSKPQPGKQNYQEMLERATDDAQRKVLESIIMLSEHVKTDNDFGYPINNHELIRFFKDMEYFKALYFPLLAAGRLRENLKQYQAFYWSMYSCNRFYFPAMNGEQCGNREASEMLMKKSLEIVQKEIQENKEDED